MRVARAGVSRALRGREARRIRADRAGVVTRVMRPSSTTQVGRPHMRGCEDQATEKHSTGGLATLVGLGHYAAEE